MPFYRDAVMNFASLHDCMKRSHEKGCINDLIPWKTSRTFFYWRLKRLIIEDQFVDKICKTYKNLSISKAKRELNF
jgi:acetyl-CoA carboxylase/biotin carboxylase 1